MDLFLFEMCVEVKLAHLNTNKKPILCSSHSQGKSLKPKTHQKHVLGLRDVMAIPNRNKATAASASIIRRNDDAGAGLVILVRSVVVEGN